MAARVIPREDFLNAIDVETRPKGETEALKKVTDFLDELALDKEEGDIQVELQQQSKGTMPGQAIMTFEIRAGEDAQEVAQQILDEAVKDGREGGFGKIRYCVVAKGRRGRKSFVLTFPETGDEDVDEYPNEKGMIALAMNMLKDCHKTILELVHDNSRSAKTVIGEQGMQLRKHTEVAVKNFEMMNDLVTAQHERQVGLIKAERGERRMDEVAGFLMTAGQVVFNTFLGKRVFEKAPTPVEHLAYATMSLFTPDQAQAMLQGQPLQLRTDQALGLFKLFEALDGHYKAQKGPQEPGAKPYMPAGVEVVDVGGGGQQVNGAQPPPSNGSGNGVTHPAASAVT